MLKAIIALEIARCFASSHVNEQTISIINEVIIESGDFSPKNIHETVLHVIMTETYEEDFIHNQD
jgi:hypothetical protein